MKVRNQLKKYGSQLAQVSKGVVARVGTGAAALGASAMALAGGATSPGAAVAGEISGGDADLMLIISACAVLVGILILWAYTKRAK